MFGDRFHRKFRYTIDTLFDTWAEDLNDYVLDTFPYLKRRKEFDLWFHLPEVNGDIRMTIRPNNRHAS